jgi:hypothetical protein
MVVVMERHVHTERGMEIVGGASGWQGYTAAAVAAAAAAVVVAAAAAAVAAVVDVVAYAVAIV